MSFTIQEQRLFDFLDQKASLQQKKEELRRIKVIDKARRILADTNTKEVPLDVLDCLQRRRAALSNTLYRSLAALDRWNYAQTMLKQWLEVEKPIGLQEICLLNGRLVGTKVSSYRCSDVFTTQVKHIAVSSVDKMMSLFLKKLDRSQKEDHPLYTAFIARYWILSIHPFSDANGRTSQLLADYILLSHGYLPQAFSSILEANLIGDPDKKSFMTPHEGFKRFSQTIINAYFILGIC